MASLVIFDDGQGRLGPLCELRPVFELRTGADRTLERIERKVGRFPAAWWVPEHLRELWASSTETPVNELPAGDVLLINGCWTGLGVLPELAPGQAACCGETVVAACLDQAAAHAWLAGGGLPNAVERVEVDVPLVCRPWDLLTHLPACLADDLASATTPRGCPDHVEVMGANAVHVHPDAVISPGVVLDATNGPVVIAAGAVIRPNAVLEGPCCICRGSTVMPQAIIRTNTVVGPVCKVGGEIGASVLQGFSNKAHAGYLGDSWLGEWVNIGASTDTSNLMNTYGEITMRVTPSSPRERTGRTFVGSFLGDHTKTAIGTRIMTGTSIGTGCMLAASTPPAACLGPLRWCTDDGDRAYRLDKFLASARGAMDRRGQVLTPALEARLAVLAEG